LETVSCAPSAMSWARVVVHGAREVSHDMGLMFVGSKLLPSLAAPSCIVLVAQRESALREKTEAGERP
jgi:hypothetical protein